jgi:hypothetical protein
MSAKLQPLINVTNIGYIIVSDIMMGWLDVGYYNIVSSYIL